MKQKNLNRALRKVAKSKQPCNAAYALLSKGQRKAFLQFARCFGMTEEKINTLLSNEKG